jgi:hypothetical protein
MTYFIFIKYLRSLEKFRKKSHVKIPPKSPCANLQSLDIFKNQILFGKEFSSLLAQPAQQPAGPSGLSAQPQHSFFPFQPAVPPSPLGLDLSAGPAHLTAQPATFFLLPHQSQTHKAPPPAGLTLPPRLTPTPPPEEKNGRINPPSFPH